MINSYGQELLTSQDYDVLINYRRKCGDSYVKNIIESEGEEMRIYELIPRTPKEERYLFLSREGVTQTEEYDKELKRMRAEEERLHADNYIRQINQRFKTEV